MEITINKDKMKSTLWQQVGREIFNLFYMSPELRNDGRVASAQSNLIDEARADIDDWGRGGGTMRVIEAFNCYAGFEAPVTTCAISTFNAIQESLDFGHRSFWHLDVLSILIMKITFIALSPQPNFPRHSHVLMLLPPWSTADTDTSTGSLRDNVCRTTFSCCKYIRNCSKRYFIETHMCNLVSTEATALGCNDRHVKYCSVFLATLSFCPDGKGRERLSYKFFPFPSFPIPRMEIFASILPDKC